LRPPYFGCSFPCLPSGAINVRVWKKRGSLHVKYFIVDDKVLVFGSSNWSIRAFSASDEAVLVTSKRNQVEAAGAKFEALWNDGRAEPLRLRPGQEPRVPAERFDKSKAVFRHAAGGSFRSRNAGTQMHQRRVPRTQRQSFGWA
jgi:phosphatidylserine/phosphatidylglycerophosphate/cardiolipin synthase-like enzyme